MLIINLPDGHAQVSVSYDAEGLPIVSHRLTPGAVWRPIETDQIDARAIWDRLLADGANEPARAAAKRRLWVGGHHRTGGTQGTGWIETTEES